MRRAATITSSMNVICIAEHSAVATLVLQDALHIKWCDFLGIVHVTVLCQCDVACRTPAMQMWNRLCSGSS